MADCVLAHLLLFPFVKLMTSVSGILAVFVGPLEIHACHGAMMMLKCGC